MPKWCSSCSSSRCRMRGHSKHAPQVQYEEDEVNARHVPAGTQTSARSGTIGYPGSSTVFPQGHELSNFPPNSTSGSNRTYDLAYGDNACITPQPNYFVGQNLQGGSHTNRVTVVDASGLPSVNQTSARGTRPKEPRARKGAKAGRSAHPQDRTTESYVGPSSGRNRAQFAPERPNAATDPTEVAFTTPSDDNVDPYGIYSGVAADMAGLQRDLGEINQDLADMSPNIAGYGHSAAGSAAPQDSEYMQSHQYLLRPSSGRTFIGNDITDSSSGTVVVSPDGTRLAYPEPTLLTPLRGTTPQQDERGIFHYTTSTGNNRVHLGPPQSEESDVSMGYQDHAGPQGSGRHARGRHRRH